MGSMFEDRARAFGCENDRENECEHEHEHEHEHELPPMALGH